jgi:hypothetical protein
LEKWNEIRVTKLFITFIISNYQFVLFTRSCILKLSPLIHLLINNLELINLGCYNLPSLKKFRPRNSESFHSTTG